MKHLQLTTYNKDQVEKLIERQPEGNNTRFLKSAHNLWFRFKNYEKHPPFVLVADSALDAGADPLALVFITFSQRSKYANLYEIVTLEGKEGMGYASKVYWRVMQKAHERGMQRLKMSCTPSSVTWHNRNGTIFWAVDPSGSLRCDVPIFPNLHEQLTFREMALKDHTIALPPENVIEKLKKEAPNSHGFGVKKMRQIEEAIKSVGSHYMRWALYEPTSASLDDFV
jgi:hypothetical protein